MDFDIQSLAGWVQSLPGWYWSLPSWMTLVAAIFIALTFVAFAFPGTVLARWALPEHDPTRFINDVLVRPSVGPATALSAWLVSALVGLVVWLTIQYAPGAAARVAQAPGADAGGIIPIWAGYLTIGLVSFLSVAFGLEPILGPRISRWTARLRQRLRPPETFGFLPRTRSDRAFGVMRGLPMMLAKSVFAVVAQALFLVWRAPSFALSLIDYLLARPLALLAGAAFRPWLARSAVLLFWVLGGASVAWVFPPPDGLIGVVGGVVAVVAIIRRWNWVERDREAFLTARGSNPAIERIGFAEDLRDEALIGIVGLFLLIPLGFRQVDLAYHAFDLAKGAAMPADEFGQVLEWVGFFGAELAKAVPLVDWSEVFHVANGSPIEPKTALGAQIVFAMRASLDLLLIAAVLQASQIASRVRDQRSAFKANRLPILDPFAELPAFRAVAAGIAKHPHVKASLQPSVVSFPTYEEKRLVDIAKGGRSAEISHSAILRDGAARRAALSILVKQYPSERTDTVLADRLTDDGEELELQLLALELLCEGGAAHAEKPLSSVLLRGIGINHELRVSAARWLGRLRSVPAADVLFARLSDESEQVAVRAQTGLALAKLGDARAIDRLAALSRSFAADASGADLIPVMTAAYASALGPLERPIKPEELADHFAASLRPHVLRAIKSARGEHEAMVRVPAGTFQMGAAAGEDEALSTEAPQHPVTVPEFELGKFTVTFDEYDAFCLATGRDLPPDEGWGRDRRPVINVSWGDAHDYCDWLYAFTGERFRLPSEGEWEYACRAGTTTPFSFGQTISIDQANYDGNYTYGRGQKGKYRQQTVPVDDPAFQPNKFGLFHMHGNVWEWCQDAWNWSYNKTGVPETERADDGSPWLTGDTGWRVLRGGSWFNDPGILRSALRIRDRVDFRYIILGFRLARTL